MTVNSPASVLKCSVVLHANVSDAFSSKNVSDVFGLSNLLEGTPANCWLLSMVPD